MSRLQQEINQIVKDSNEKYDAHLKREASRVVQAAKLMKKFRVVMTFLVGYIYLLYITLYASQFAPWLANNAKDALAIQAAWHQDELLYTCLHVCSVYSAFLAYSWIKAICEVNDLTPIKHFSCMFLEGIVTISGLLFVTFVWTTSLYSVLPHLVLLGLCITAAVIHLTKPGLKATWINAQAELNVRVQSLVDSASEDEVEDLDAAKRCEICDQESKYDICMDCEVKYRGERHRVRAQVLRAKQQGNDATLTLREWLDILNTFHWNCAYCQKDPFTDMEHYVPVSQGGGTTAENVLPSCKTCNSKKADKHPEEEARPYKPFQPSVPLMAPKSTKRRTR